MHEGGEIEFDSVLRGVVMVNEVVHDRACVVVHGLEDIGSWNHKGNFLCQVLGVFYHVTPLVNRLLHQVELLHSALERVTVQRKYLLQIPDSTVN